MTEHDVTDLSLAPAGTLTIEWAERSMSVLRQVRERFDELTPVQEEYLSSGTHGT